MTAMASVVAAAERGPTIADIGKVDERAGDLVSGEAPWGGKVAALFDGDLGGQCAIRQGQSIVRRWQRPVTVTQIDVYSHYWPKGTSDNKWIYQYRVLARRGDSWRTVSEFGGDKPVHSPAMAQPCRSGRGYFAGHAVHHVGTGGLPVVTDALQFELVKAYGRTARLCETAIRGVRSALDDAELAALRTKLLAARPPARTAKPRASKMAAADAGALLLADGREMPSAFRGKERILITGACPDVVWATNPRLASIGRGHLGGIDAGLPGDGEAFRVSRMKIGKSYYRTPDRITVKIDTSRLQGDLWLDFDHRASQYGTRRMDVLLDGECIGRFDCAAQPHGPRRAGGSIPRSRLRNGVHELTFAEGRAVYYVVLDCIRLVGDGLRIVAADGTALDGARLAALDRQRAPHLPRRFSMPTGALGFDFGAADSPVWVDGGFRAVRPTDTFSSRAGFGWDRLVEAADLAKMDVLRRDYHFRAVEQDEARLATFSASVPKGRYHLLVIAGLAPYDTKGMRIAKLRINDTITASFPFFNRKDTLLGEPSVHHRFFTADVNDERLRLSFADGNYFLINGLMVWPDRIDREMRALAWQLIHDYYLPVCTEITPGRVAAIPQTAEERVRLKLTEGRLESVTDVDRTIPLETPVAVPAELREEGYVLFQRPYDRFLYPHSAPTEGDRVKPPFDVAAARGEFEPLQLGLRALRDLPDLRVTVSRLDHVEADDSLPASLVAIRRGEVAALSPTTSQGGQFTRGARCLVPASARTVAANTTELYWLTFQALTTTRPGTYRGRLRIECGRAPREFPVRLRVRPFTLRVPKRLPQGFWWSSNYFYVNAEEHLDAQIADMAAHGMRGIVLYASDGAPEVTLQEDGRFALDFTGPRRILRLLKKHRFDGSIALYKAFACLRGAFPEMDWEEDEAFRSAIQRTYRAIIGEYQRAGFDVMFYPEDEPSAGKRLDAAIRRLKAIKELVPEARTFVTCTISNAKAMSPWLDVRSYCGIRPGWVESARTAGDVAYTYGGVYGTAANRSVRIAAGFGLWTCGAVAKNYWVYCWPKSNGRYDLDNDGKDTGAVAPSAHGPVPTINYECLREGIDDLNYLHTALECAEEARRAGRVDIANQGQRTLDELLAKFDDTGRGKEPQGDLHEYREVLARVIAKCSSQGAD